MRLFKEDRLRRDRKYTAFWGVFLVATVALFVDKINGDNYVNIVWTVFGLFMAGNVGEHWTRRDRYNRYPRYNSHDYEYEDYGEYR